MIVPASQRTNSQRNQPKEQGASQGKVPESLSSALSWERNSPSVKEPQSVLPPRVDTVGHSRPQSATVDNCCTVAPMACCLEPSPPESLLPHCLCSLVGRIVFIDSTGHICPVWSPPRAVALKLHKICSGVAFNNWDFSQISK